MDHLRLFLFHRITVYSYPPLDQVIGGMSAARHRTHTVNNEKAGWGTGNEAKDHS